MCIRDSLRIAYPREDIGVNHPLTPAEPVLETGTKGSLFRTTPVATFVEGGNVVDSFTRQVTDHPGARGPRGDIRLPSQALRNQAYWVLDCRLVPDLRSLLRPGF